MTNQQQADQAKIAAIKASYKKTGRLTADDRIALPVLARRAPIQNRALLIAAVAKLLEVARYMGLIANIFRSDYDCSLNVFNGKKAVTLVNVEGPFAATDDRPAALVLEWAPFGKGAGRTMAIIVPAEFDGDRYRPVPGVMFGGAYCASSDSRFWEHVKFVTGVTFANGALPIHDRKEF